MLLKSYLCPSTLGALCTQHGQLCKLTVVRFVRFKSHHWGYYLPEVYPAISFFVSWPLFAATLRHLITYCPYFASHPMYPLNPFTCILGIQCIFYFHPPCTLLAFHPFAHKLRHTVGGRPLQQHTGSLNAMHGLHICSGFFLNDARQKFRCSPQIQLRSKAPARRGPSSRYFVERVYTGKK